MGTYICKNCGKKFQSDIKHRYCSEECKQKYKNKLYLFTCDCCGKEFYGKKQRSGTKYFCSKECRSKVHNQVGRQNIIAKRQKRLEEGIEGYDYITCKLCGLKAVQLNNAHFTMFHPGMSLSDYRNMFPGVPCVCQKHIDTYLKGDNNPRSAANISQEEIRKSSPFCKEFYDERGMDDSVRMGLMRKIADRPDDRHACKIEYYLAKGYTEDEAIEMRRKMYGFTMEKAIEKYGKEEGRKIFLDRQRKWIDTMYGDSSACKCKKNVSRISQKFVFDVLGGFSNCDKTFRFGKNEYEIDGLEHIYKYDLTCLQNKRIIEFHGDLWHGNPMIYKATDTNCINGQLYADKWEYDAKKKKAAEDMDFEVMVVWERDYKYFRDRVVQEAKDFIFEGVDTSGMNESVTLF